MNAIPAPIRSLEDQLREAERDLLCANNIDRFDDWVEATDRAKARIEAIKAKIEARNGRAERAHLEAAVAAMGDRHAG